MTSAICQMSFDDTHERFCAHLHLLLCQGHIGQQGAHQELGALVMGEVEACQVQLAPGLPPLPLACQLLIQVGLSTVLLQGINLACLLQQANA